MRVGFLFSKENHLLAQAEIAALLQREEKSEETIFYMTEIDQDKIKELKKRLAYTVSIFEVLFITTKETLEEHMRLFDWKSVYTDSFSVRIKKLEHSSLCFTEKKLAGDIWRNLESPQVVLKNPKTPFVFFFGKNVYACKKIGDVEKTYLQRQPKTRPALHPSTLQPRLARAIVNVTGAKKGDCILDPFCGSGGILIEAGLMGLKTEGYDIEKKMIAACTKNLSHYNIKRFHLEEHDARTIDKNVDFIATDVPYGRNTKTTGELKNLLLLFLKNLKKHLQRRAVIIFPDFVPYDALIKEAELQKKSEFSVYVHNTLTRKIVVLEP